MHTSSITPDEAIKMLEQGNGRYLDNRLDHPNIGSERRALTSSEGQSPFATVLSCSDSRVPVELIFDRGIGDVFIVRVAGNVVGASELASIEYAVDHLGTPVFLVLGHTKCGAVHAVAGHGLLPGNLRCLSERILPAVEQSQKANPGLTGDDLVYQSVKNNVWKSMEDALKSSACLREKAKTGGLKVIGAVYDVHTGKIEWMGTHPAQNEMF